MRHTRSRQRTVRAAVRAVSMAVLAAACAKATTFHPGTNPTGGPASLTLTDGNPLAPSLP